MNPGLSLDPEVLGQLLVMQSLLGNLPDDQSVMAFVCRGLQKLPGVEAVAHRAASGKDDENLYKPLEMDRQDFGGLEIALSNPQAFRPYEPYVDNFCFMLAVVLEERRRRVENQEQRAALERQSADLKANLEELRKAQTRLIETEKMITLWQLTGSLAHEINTPLGAICSSATFIDQTLREMVVPLLQFVRGLNEDDYHLFVRLQANSPRTFRSWGPEERHRKHRVLTQLPGIALGDETAEAIVLLTEPPNEPELIRWAREGRAELLRRAAHVVEMAQSNLIILQSADQAAQIVDALRRFARPSSGTLAELVDPAADLEALLLLYFGRFRNETTIERRFEAGLRFPGNRDQLNEVWVTVLTHAFRDSNRRQGLVLTTQSTGDWVEVGFSLAQANLLEGPELELCLRVASAHQGEFLVQQGADRTVFSMRIPHRRDFGSSLPLDGGA